MGEVCRFNIYGEDVIIREFKDSDSISIITQLLHKSYKQLANMGFKYLASHQNGDETERRLKNGISYVALIKDNIIATVSLYYNRKKQVDPKWYQRAEVAYFGQFGVDPEYQKNGIGNLMMDIIENKAKELGASELALDTAEGADHLIKYYEKRGYRFIEYVNWEVTNYRSVIMSKNLLNQNNL